MARLLRMPGISADAEEVVFLEWCSALGSTVKAGAPIATVETEKANVDIEADDEAILWRTLISPGEAVTVGAPIAILVGVDEEFADENAILDSLGIASEQRSKRKDDVVDSQEPAANVTDSDSPCLATPEANGHPVDRIFASPLARKLARENGLAIDAMIGSGPGGRIVRVDVEKAVANNPTVSKLVATSAGNERTIDKAFREIPHSGMRRAIARTLTASKQQVPHFYLDATCRVDELLALRQTVNSDGSVKLSINDFILKAVGKALIDVPEMNVVWTEDCVRQFDSADVCVAIGSESELVTPVLRGVEALTLTQISEQVRDLVARANEGRLKQQEIEGGAFSVSNLGMFGVESFSAILNPPQAGILAVGVVSQVPVVSDGELTVGHVLKVTLSVDHRPVDGISAATWLRRFQTLVENPALILV